MRNKSIYILVIFSVMLTACYYDNKEDVYQNFPNDCVTVGMTYSVDIKPIIDEKCNICHSPNSLDQQPYLTTIASLINNEQKIRTRISLPQSSGGYMPKGGSMSQCTIDQILAWYDAGSPQ